MKFTTPKKRYTKSTKNPTLNIHPHKDNEENYLRNELRKQLISWEKKHKVPFEPASGLTLEVIQAKQLSIQFDEKKGPYSTEYKDWQYREEIVRRHWIRDLSTLEKNMGPKHPVVAHMLRDLTLLRKLVRELTDPEIQVILQDPKVRQVIQNLSGGDVAAGQRAMSDPVMRGKIEKLIASGVLQTK